MCVVVGGTGPGIHKLPLWGLVVRVFMPHSQSLDRLHLLYRYVSRGSKGQLFGDFRQQLSCKQWLRCGHGGHGPITLCRANPMGLIDYR